MCQHVYHYLVLSQNCNLYVIRHMNNVIRHIYFDNLRKTSIFASRITNLEDSYLHT